MHRRWEGWGHSQTSLLFISPENKSGPKGQSLRLRTYSVPSMVLNTAIIMAKFLRGNR